MGYLFAAYAVTWLLIYAYLARISARQNRLLRDIEVLRQQFGELEAPGAAAGE